MRSHLYRGSRVCHRLLGVILLASPVVLAQSESMVTTPANQPEVGLKIDRLTRSLELTQAELAQSRTEIQQLRAALQEVLTRMDAISPGPNNSPSQARRYCHRAPG